MIRPLLDQGAAERVRGAPRDDFKTLSHEEAIAQIRRWAAAGVDEGDLAQRTLWRRQDIRRALG